MSFKAEIPYGAYWSTPFARWQGSFANLHSIEFAAHVARLELAKRKIDPASASTTACSASPSRKNTPSTACPGSPA
jgi:acetyl-CoA acetyltransferase